MPDSDSVLDHHDLILRPDPSRTVIRPFSPEYPDNFRTEGHSRAQVIVDRVVALGGAELDAELKAITDSLDERHRDVDDLLRRRFDEVAKLLDGEVPEDDACRRLIGAYFSEEFSFESAALFNPSAVLGMNQEGVPEGSLRFALSLRGIGEGHVSSVTFRTGIWTPGGEICVDKPSRTAVPPIVDTGDEETGSVRLRCEQSRELSETVLFPILPSQRQGIEDLRLVRFQEDDGNFTYYGTFTAFDGRDARPALLTGYDFQTFEMRRLTGDAAGAKGMALFPRKVNGQYVMLGRQDSENIWLQRSDDVTVWNEGVKIVSPQFPWEYVQMGNCGSPIEIDEGWLVFTHGVGTVRNYCMGACLLDKHDPAKLLARTPEPILKPSPDERDGYVPNVVYSCGAMIHGRDVMLPFGVADNFAAFATTTVDRLLKAMS
ncbi:putative GH43/DUF377 family glycosyl hydrolase [Sphingomonas vulcanisoli]|uniref:GH43/DUF377 family glycosyl hydrolase n=1 Tax=Sphingomonas vulcanisoli TaxID=1658060 RepID=A0ABX0TT21_9SPHN|nr:glycoside hydrolase family 130 protein [Sphingomonas vulcanisoli]NIJ08601.1 putative GH43/DUF377 family glycosyl hydrolase [Sphingomonas vulcanisoli]